MHRRHFLSTTTRAATAAATTSAALGPAAWLLSPAAQAAGLQPLGAPQPFDYAWLKGRARELAAKPYQAPPSTLPPGLDDLDFDRYQAISFKGDHALWGDDKLRFQARLFHLGLFFKKPVHIHEVADGRAQELAYDPGMFDYGKSGVNGKKLPKTLGFAGFRLNFHTGWTTDVCAFLGASYFRAVGGERQYGLSARGLAIDTAVEKPEEFPDFTAFYLEKPAPESTTVVVYALLDSPSVAGAYRFAITPGDVLLMDVDAALYPRVAIDRVGIAPLTSMFQTGENDRRMGNDWRTEIHDSDGLAIQSGSGEWIWRPLANPHYIRHNVFSDENPRGFGLLQRDRVFDHYQDDGVFYDRRPCLWVEPKHGWGAGSVQLVEIPTNDETFDNIVAFWNPAAKPQPGQEVLVGYRLYWGAEPPVKPVQARVVATRTGIGGIVGQKRTKYSMRFAVDFAGGDLSLLDPQTEVKANISVSRGTTEIVSARPLGAIRGIRAMFDLVPDERVEPINLRLWLSIDGRPVSETWVYQVDPPPMEQRKLY